MKKLLGGYLILNLCMLSMTLGTSQVSITDEEALQQLRNLRDHIQKDYDFKRPLNNQIKPIQLRIRDQKNGEKQESVVWGNLAIFDTALKFKIEALVDSASMKALQIEVVFEEKTDDGNKYFDIKTAKYLYTKNIAIGGDLTVTGAINGEQNPSVKPIYYHGIIIGGDDIEMQLVILDNQSTKYTKTTCKEKLLELLDSGAIINCNGAVKVSSNVYPIYLITKYDNNDYRLAYHTTTSTQELVNFVSVYDASTYFLDGLNKIN